MNRVAMFSAVVCLTVVSALAQEPKNVQLLKGLTPTELQRTMNMMRDALGVHCDFCHVFKDDKWDSSGRARGAAARRPSLPDTARRTSGAAIA